MKKFLFVLGLVVSVFVFANLAMANIDADSDTDCTNGTQESFFPQGTNIVIWWTDGSNPPDGEYCAVLTSKSGTLEDTVTFDASCDKSGVTIFHDDDTFSLVAPTPGSVRLSVCEGACPCDKGDKTVGGDSFRVGEE